jgi:ribonuclease VapC
VTSSATVVIDSSVIVAVFRKEPDATALFERAARYERRVISAATWLESAMVCEGKIEFGGGPRFDEIVLALSIEIVPVTAEQAELGREAFKRFGKGRRTNASLSFGDCFSYALAKCLDAPLLFKGNDFAQTDIALG